MCVEGAYVHSGRDGVQTGPRGRLLHDTSGAAAVEFSRVALPFIAIVVATLELAVDYL